ncbi:phosphopantetheine-binding protein [Streptomyces virginiae]|uniref:phosphopantetheine-binding protein n=1 Tax=Streptomyces virginiae TaxID=1961 RepID=UPI0022593F4F|nr:phosphopantetheine-binding protein [Streptomyces virginiae]MCX5176232.1 phosphopantetheine-binding protein [Streptomyces virginiae]
MLTTVDRDELLSHIRDHIVNELLRDSEGVELAADTPLLEWGILDSLSTMRLLNFLRQDLKAPLTTSDLVGDNFRDLNSLVDFILTAHAQRQDA